MFSKKLSFFKRIISICVINCFFASMFLPTLAQAQDLSALPAPTQFVHLSNAYSFPVLKGLKFDPAKPLEIEFIIDTSNQKKVSEEEASTLIRYFLAGLTIPENELWVNMSPYEQDKMITHSLSETDLGKDLLSQDYILKQLSSSLTYPESDTGKDFWEKTYQEVQKVANTTKIPVNTFNKIWIMPDKAVVYENNNIAVVKEATLKTMLEEDYLALRNNTFDIKKQTKKDMPDELINKVNEASSKVVRQALLPKINAEVNSGKNFATLRQIYFSLILASWFKDKFKDSIYKHYIDKGKTAGIDINDKDAKDKIYNLYVEAFTKGVYNYIKTDFDQASGKNIKRQYFSGGAEFTGLGAARQTVSVAPVVMSAELSASGTPTVGVFAKIEDFAGVTAASSPMGIQDIAHEVVLLVAPREDTSAGGLASITNTIASFLQDVQSEEINGTDKEGDTAKYNASVGEINKVLNDEEGSKNVLAYAYTVYLLGDARETLKQWFSSNRYKQGNIYFTAFDFWNKVYGLLKERPLFENIYKRYPSLEPVLDFLKRKGIIKDKYTSGSGRYSGESSYEIVNSAPGAASSPLTRKTISLMDGISIELESPDVPDGVLKGDDTVVAALSERTKQPLQTMTGWKNWPKKMMDELKSQGVFSQAQELRERIGKGEITNLIFIGIGGSAAPLEAELDLLYGNAWRTGAVEGVHIFILDTPGEEKISGVMKEIKDDGDSEFKKTAAVVISKSGGTLEPDVNFRGVKHALLQAHGEKANEYIYAITDGAKGALYDETIAQRYHKAGTVPDEIGGRFSIFTAVGMFLMGVLKGESGVRVISEGAASYERQDAEGDASQKPALQIAKALSAVNKQSGGDIVFWAYDKERWAGEKTFLEQINDESLGEEGKGPSAFMFLCDRSNRDGLEKALLKRQDLHIHLVVDEFFKANSRLEQEFNARYAKLKAQGLPQVVIRIPKMDASNLGFFMQLKHNIIAYAGEFLLENPNLTYTQEGVQTMKNYVDVILGKSDKADVKARLGGLIPAKRFAFGSVEGTTLEEIARTVGVNLEVEHSDDGNVFLDLTNIVQVQSQAEGNSEASIKDRITQEADRLKQAIESRNPDLLSKSGLSEADIRKAFLFAAANLLVGKKNANFWAYSEPLAKELEGGRFADYAAGVDFPSLIRVTPAPQGQHSVQNGVLLGENKWFNTILIVNKHGDGITVPSVKDDALAGKSLDFIVNSEAVAMSLAMTEHGRPSALVMVGEMADQEYLVEFLKLSVAIAGKAVVAPTEGGSAYGGSSPMAILESKLKEAYSSVEIDSLLPVTSVQGSGRSTIGEVFSIYDQLRICEWIKNIGSRAEKIVLEPLGWGIDLDSDYWFEGSILVKLVFKGPATEEERTVEVGRSSFRRYSDRSWNDYKPDVRNILILSSYLYEVYQFEGYSMPAPVNSVIFDPSLNIPPESDISELSEELIQKINVASPQALAAKNLNDTFSLLETSVILTLEQKKELEDLLTGLYDKASPYFKEEKAVKENPVYHHTQALYNMARIALGEGCEYLELKNMLVLALLHDIGNAISIGNKWTNDQIIAAFAEAEKPENADQKEELFNRAVEIAEEGKAFRLEHMDKGPQLINEVVRDYIDKGILRKEDVDLINRAVTVHDYPSVEKNNDGLRKKGIRDVDPAGVFLLPFNDHGIGRLVTFLREADRLFMLSVQGAIKDIKDSNRKNEARGRSVVPINLQSVSAQGKKNIESHEGEYSLYENAGKDDGGFINNESLYRTKTGYAIFKEAEKIFSSSSSPMTNVVITAETPTDDRRKDEGGTKPSSSPMTRRDEINKRLRELRIQLRHGVGEDELLPIRDNTDSAYLPPSPQEQTMRKRDADTRLEIALLEAELKRIEASSASSSPMAKKAAQPSAEKQAVSDAKNPEYGGIDLGGIDVEAAKGSSPININMPEIDLENFKGFTFRIIRMEQITNPSSIFGIGAFQKAEEPKPPQNLAYLRE